LAYILRRTFPEKIAAARPQRGITAMPNASAKKPGKFLFTALRGLGQSMTRQSARLLSEWIASIALDPRLFIPRRTKATLTAAPATCEPYSYCSTTPKLRAPSDISALRWMTLFPSPNRLTSAIGSGGANAYRRKPSLLRGEA
jgi:hypothetical protein